MDDDYTFNRTIMEVDTTTLNDNEYFDLIRKHGFEFEDVVLIFRDSRIEIMNELFAIMIVKKHLSLSFGTAAVFNVSYLIDTMITSCQMKALECMYQASLMYDFVFTTDRMEFNIGTPSSDKIKVFQWWMDTLGLHGFNSYITNSCITSAMLYAEMDVLNWFAQYESIFLYDEIKLAIEPIKVLNYLWDMYEENRIQFVYTNTINHYLMYEDLLQCYDAIDNLILICEWFYARNDQIEFKYGPQVFKYVNQPTLSKVYQWFYDRKHQIGFQYDDECIDDLCGYNNYSPHIIVGLNWWYDRKDEIELKYTDYAMDYCSIEILQWWYDRRHDLKLKYSNFLTRFGHVNADDISERKEKILWLYDRRYDLEFKYDRTDLQCFTLDTIIWWIENIIEFPLELKAATIAWLKGRRGFVALVQYCLDNTHKFIVSENLE
jgi:hypothetical protein